MIIWKSISLKLALILYIAVAAVGMVAAHIAQYYSNWEVQQMLNTFGEAHASEATPAIIDQGTRISSHDLTVRPANTLPPFSKFEGDDIGLVKPNLFSVEDFWPPFYYGRGIASGDFNNDGWLDLFLTAYRQGNHYILNDKGHYRKQNLVSLKGSNKSLSFGLTFGDLDKDGDLDATIGNWFYGWPKEIPPEAGRPDAPLLLTVISPPLHPLLGSKNQQSHHS